MEELTKAMSEMMEDETTALTQNYLEQGKSPLDIFEAYKAAMVIIGKRFEEGVYFVPELILAGEMMKNGSELIKPYLQDDVGSEKKDALGRFLIGTVQGDIHDIGKDIVGLIFEINGFEVMDLGVDVPAARFLEACDEFKPDVIGLSGFLSLAYDPMKEVVDGLAAKGVRDRIKVLIGGGQVDEQVSEYVGADAFATDAVTGLNHALEWIKQ